MVDIGPTLLDLAGVPVPEYMDGHSWKPFLLAPPETGGGSGGSASRVVVPGEAAAWRDVALVEYQSVRTYGGRHQIDGPNNTYIALRIVNSTHELLYAEFTDVSRAANWDFGEGTINFYELYNITADYFQLTNIYATADDGLKEALHKQLHRMFRCSGQAACP